jgi:hypothetical protein
MYRNANKDLYYYYYYLVKGRMLWQYCAYTCIVHMLTRINEPCVYVINKPCVRETRSKLLISLTHHCGSNSKGTIKSTEKKVIKIIADKIN